MEADKIKQKIEEEIQWLRSVVIPEMIKNKKLMSDDSTKISVGEISIKFIGLEESFMLTNCYRATVETNLDNKKHQSCLVVKKTPQVPIHVFDLINFGALFNNEIIAYNTILPTIENFTKEPLKVPRYYYGDLQRSFATIVLEDFGVDGWRIAKGRYNLSLDHILAAVIHLGEFHGIGFAMRHVQRSKFDAITASLKEPRYDNQITDNWLQSQKHCLKRLVNVTRELEPSVSEDFLKKLEKILIAQITDGKQRVRPREPFITLCHGDFLRNNIAFQYAHEVDEEKPIKTMVFDLQTMQLSSPMMDLVVLLLLSAFTDVRYNNFQNIFNSYCNALIKSYETYAGKKAPSHFSHDALLREFILFMPYGIQIVSFFLMLLVAPIDGLNSEDFLQNQQTPEQIESDVMSRGGELVNKELSHQVKEMFDLVQQYDVDLSEGITRPGERHG